jgi:ataxia telangiectasia mutated family protein
MEQVFGLVNVVLQRDRETRKRTLSVRDYKVVPLASQAGVLEFVGSTMPLREWLHTAHRVYRPGDLNPTDVQNKFAQTHKECGGQVEPLLNLFTEIRHRFEPVMRHYFTEKHKTPISWFAMRLNYTRSVATTSIVGHVLGLGDRHSSNILLDNGSGEVVHIDLGIAFDQGKLLPVPERVPFRMTRDIVDGMGTSGTQGVFQRCAEETLRVLRDRSDVIMTVLEVFKHDPLYSWTASELKIKRAQSNSGSTTTTHHDATRGFGGIGIDMSSGTADEAADRALTSVARKLDKALSVEYTVNELIAEATDPVNLATIYHGWGPHL